MDPEELEQHAKKMVETMVHYFRTLDSLKVLPQVKPGFLTDCVPKEAPVEGESVDDMLADVERLIIPGTTHWLSPSMHAYFPALTSVPSILGDMLSLALNSLCFTWASCPSGTELEMVVMDWLAKMLDLPSQFLHTSEDSNGGGVILTTCSEGTLNSLLAARRRAIDNYRFLQVEQSKELSDSEINGKLIAYCSDLAHSSLEKNSLIALVRIRFLETDPQTGGLRGNVLWKAIETDLNDGLVPFY
ncbi:hypothetical protein Ciccas_013366, partial [Cichlidogyrus casuarinus]